MGDNQTIGQRIATVRGDMKQTDFAARVGVGRTTLIRYESGERLPDSDFLARLIAEFDVDPVWILIGGAVPKRELNTREKALLNNYRHCQPEGKDALEKTSAALAQSKCNKKVG